MVEQMVSSNLSKYGLGKCASIISGSDAKPVALVVKETTVRNEQNDNNPRPSENPALHKEEAVAQPFQPKSPQGSSNFNRNLVYARRKSDAELSNSRSLDKNRTSGYQQAEQVGDKKPGSQTEAKIKGDDGVQSCARIPINSVANRSRSCENEETSFPVMEHWSARFGRLQSYLKQCDSSSQEGYLEKLRSFSPDECSRRAVELERRAIQLMLEEGREIERVKDLNVVGKSGPQLVFKSEKLL